LPNENKAGKILRRVNSMRNGFITVKWI